MLPAVADGAPHACTWMFNRYGTIWQSHGLAGRSLADPRPRASAPGGELHAAFGQLQEAEAYCEAGDGARPARLAGPTAAITILGAWRIPRGELRRPQVSRDLFVEHESEQRAASDAIEHLDASAVALGDQLDHV